jgi:hypothetical protein
MKKLLVLVVVLVLVGAASWAQSTMGSGQWLYDLWQSYQRSANGTGALEDAANFGLYMGFVVGAATTMGDGNWLNFRTRTI